MKSGANSSCSETKTLPQKRVTSPLRDGQEGRAFASESLNSPVAR